MDIMEKYRHDVTIRHDREVLSKFCEDLALALQNKGTFSFTLIEKDQFIDLWLERYYFHKKSSTEEGEKVD